MNILLTNDDGCEAPGLAAAFDALDGLGTVRVVAPESERSACSHAITISHPITIEHLQHERFGPAVAVDGSPADCVRLGYATLIEEPIDLVVSGINRGANAGVDTFYSGTVAAAREAAILGCRAIAVSQAIRKGLETDWAATRDVTRYLIESLLEESLPGPGFWSINLPAPLPTNPAEHVHRVPIASHPMPLTFDRADTPDTEGSQVMKFKYGASYWQREVTGPSDYSVIRDGGIAISVIPLFGKF